LAETERPDLLLLDIQLPDCTGFDVLAEMGHELRAKMQVIFVTAFDQFALKAFSVNALDYLLKPIEPDRFAESLDRVKRTLKQPVSGGLAERLEALLNTLHEKTGSVRRILVQDGQRSLFVDVAKIDWIESARNYACLHVGGQTHVVRSTLEALAAKLDPRQFRRLNRSEIVNIDRIAEIRAYFHGDQKVLLKDGTELMWSRRYRSESLADLERA
jgi:two-component system LytT family response regulator